MNDVSATDDIQSIAANFPASRFFRNCLSVRESADGLVPLRFTEAQLAVYAKTEQYRARSLCPAGIKIDVVTDSRFIKIDYSVGALIRGWVNFDIHLDGVLVDSLTSAPPTQSKGSLRWKLPDNPGGSRQLSVYLSQCAELTVRRLGFSAGASVREAPAGKGRLLCLGDSITQGMEAHHPSCTYAVLLARALGYDLLNQGVGGFVFDADSLDPALAFKPDIVTVAYGTNDWNRCASHEAFAYNAATYLEKLIGIFPESRIAVLSPIWRKDLREIESAGTFRSIGKTIERICTLHPTLRFMDGMDLIPHQERFFGDGKLHPTDEGFAHFALNLTANLSAKS